MPLYLNTSLSRFPLYINIHFRLSALIYFIHSCVAALTRGAKELDRINQCFSRKRHRTVRITNGRTLQEHRLYRILSLFLSVAVCIRRFPGESESSLRFHPRETFVAILYFSLSLFSLAPRRREIPLAERWQVSRRRIYRTRPSSRRYLYSGYFYYREVSKDSKFPRHGASSFLLVLFVCFNIVRDDSRKEERKRGTEEYEILFPRGENVRAPIEHPRISLRTFSGRIFSTFNKSQISQVLQEKSIFLFFVSPLRSAKVSPCALFVSFQDERARERS